MGIAAKLGRAHVLFWVGAMVLFYLPLAAVVIHVNRLMPLRAACTVGQPGYGEMAGFLMAWNLWVYAVAAPAALFSSCPRISHTCGPIVRLAAGERVGHVGVDGG